MTSPNRRTQVCARIRAAQRRAPIAIGPFGPEVLSYELARSILRDTRFVIPPGLHLSAQGVTSGPLWDRVVGSIICAEGAEHHRLRSLVSRAFTPRAISRLHDTIGEVVNELVDGVADAGRCDIVTDIARHYPIPIICALLGAPRADWSHFERWAEAIFKMVNFSVNLVDEMPAVLRGWAELDAYVDEMVAERRHHLTDDLLSNLIRAEDDGDRLNCRRTTYDGGRIVACGNGYHPQSAGRFLAGAARSPGAMGDATRAPRTRHAGGRGEHAPLARRVQHGPHRATKTSS